MLKYTSLRVSTALVLRVSEATVPMQEFDRAIDDFSQAIALTPDDPAFYLHRSYSRLGKGQTDEADADMEKAQSLQEEARPERGTP
jgi:Flp pilus assembly protein TadD